MDSDSPSQSIDSRRSKFPSISDIFHVAPAEFGHKTRETGTSSLVRSAFDSWSISGPFMPRLIIQDLLARPMVVVSLQRDTIEVGGNLGMLSIGELPDGVNSSDLTWVPLRAYSSSMGGIPAPADSPSEVRGWSLVNDVLTTITRFRCIL